MVLDCECGHDCLSGLNVVAQKFIKFVFINAFARNGAVEAAETSAAEGVFSYVNNSCFSG